MSNPFDNALSFLNELQNQVTNLSNALRAEQEERMKQVAELTSALAQEQQERLARDQSWNNALTDEASRLSAAQHRVSKELGEVRMELHKETNDRTQSGNTIAETLDSHVVRLQGLIDHSVATEAYHYGEICEALKREAQMRQQEVEANSARDAEVEQQLREAIREEMDELDQFKKHTEELQKGMMKGVEIISDTFRTFKQATEPAHDRGAKRENTRQSLCHPFPTSPSPPPPPQ